MSSRLHYYFILLALGLLTGLLSACGGGGASSTSTTTTPAGKGSVGILLTDAPADPGLFSAINLTISKAELLGGDGRRVPLFSGSTQYDLLQLRNQSAPFTFSDQVPAGTYCKVRLTLAPNGLELVLADGVTKQYPRLTGNRKLDLLARDCFTVTPGGTVTLQLDMAAGDSIHVVKRGNQDVYNFRPVVFINVLNKGFPGKLVHLTGRIAKVDPVGNSLLLCKALTTPQGHDRSCVRVLLGKDSAYFDNLNRPGGMPGPLSELLVDGNIGQPATVVGLFRSPTPYRDLQIPVDRLPGAGECRVWRPGLDASQQPLPGDCGLLAQALPGDAVLIDDAGHPIKDYRPLLRLDGLAVELGDFLSLDGRVASDATSSGFDMQVSPAQPVAAGMLAVALQAGTADFNGTRILGKRGELLDYTAITSSRAISVDGVLQTSNSLDDLLNAAVVILDTDTLAQQVTGRIAQLTTRGFVLTPADGQTPCGQAAGDPLQVTLASDLAITSLTIDDSGYQVAPGGVPAVDQAVGLSGVCENGGLTAQTLVIVDDRRSTAP